MAWADTIMNIETKMIGNTMKRVVRTIPTVQIDAKCRGGLVKDGWEWSANDKENYDKFRSIYK